MDSKFRAFARLAGQKNHHLVVLLGARVVVAAVAFTVVRILNSVSLSMQFFSFSEIEAPSGFQKKESISNPFRIRQTEP